MNTENTALVPVTDQYMQVAEFRQKFTDRQKDMTIAVLFSRAFTEMRFRCRHDYRGTDIPMMATRLELTDTVNQMVYDLSKNDDGRYKLLFKVFTFWDRKQSNNTFMRVFRYDDSGTIMPEPVIDMEITNMATLESVMEAQRNVKGPMYAIRTIREAFVAIHALTE